MTEVPRRRRRVRAAGETDPAPTSTTGPVAATNPVHDPDVEAGADDRDAERGLRGLVGGGSTQVSVAAAMRARDATRPSAADLAAAEANLTIVRRGWTPPPNTAPAR